MSQAPRRNPPPPSPTPDDPFQLQPVRPAPERNLTAEILTISVIVSGIVLLGIAVMLWFQENFPAGPYPTATLVAVAPTITQSIPEATDTLLTTPPTETETPTEATEVGVTPEQTQTLGASIHLPGVVSDPNLSATGTPDGTPRVVVVVVTGVYTDPESSDAATVLTGTPQPPDFTSTPTATSGPQIVSLPYLSWQEPPPTPTPLPPTDTPQPTATLPVPTPVQGATSTTVPAGTPLGTPLATPVETATEAPTGIPYVDDDMSARMISDAIFYLGPSAVYTATDQLGVNTQITLRGRDSSGEWLYACCVDDDDVDDVDDDLAWVRHVNVTIEGNELENVDEDDDFDRNEARWLPIVPVRDDLRPLPEITPPPPEMFPLYRYTPDNRGQLEELPNLANASKMWTIEPEAGGALISPMVVANSLVYAGSSDGHIYSWNRVNGSQFARKNLPANVSVPLATDDGLIYAAAENGWLYALQDPIDGDPVWSYQMGSPPITGINVFSHTLFVNVSGQLIVIDGEDGALIANLAVPGNTTYPTIGGQLLYLMDNDVKAYDAMTLIEYGRQDLIWQSSGIPVSQVPFVYSTPGIESIAELFVVGTNNRVYNLDANTGRLNWEEDNEEPIRSIAVNDTTLFITGEGYVKARTRAAEQDGIDPVLWRTAIAGTVIGGLYVDNDHVIAFLQSGNILFLDARSGEILGNLLTYPAAPSAAGAVSVPFVYAPGLDGKLHGFQQAP